VCREKLVSNTITLLVLVKRTASFLYSYKNVFISAV